LRYSFAAITIDAQVLQLGGEARGIEERIELFALPLSLLEQRLHTLANGRS
jgi:hypothetical protein